MKNVILQGIAGSQAFGLAHADSDIDRVGVFVATTKDLFSLDPLEETHSFKGPEGDMLYHEAAKFARLALRCNPSILEILHLEEYETAESCGLDLVDIRSSFLSEKLVVNSYLGYARSQLYKLQRRNTEGQELPSRIKKHARHLYRLLQQGHQLASTGELTVRVADPEDVMAFGERVAGGDLDYASDMVDHYSHLISTCDSVLPEGPDVARVQQWLYDVRHRYYEPVER